MSVHRKLISLGLLLILALALQSNGGTPSATKTTTHRVTRVSRDKKQVRPLSAGTRITDAERERVIERGMRFVYRTARSSNSFAANGADYVWWFAAVSSTFKSEHLRHIARGMAMECARRWLMRHQVLPAHAERGHF